jgi:hypothetical protein
MTPHTDHTAAGTTSRLLANRRVFWSLVTAIVVAMITLTGWTAVQASVVGNTLDGNGPEHPSIRQLERRNEQAVKEQPFVSIRQAERVGQHDAVDRRQQPSIRQAERAAQVRAEWLRRMEYNELRRFRNRAPADALDALDQEIRRLSAPHI